MMIFGRSGAQLIPLLANGAAGLAEMRKEADRLGITMTTVDATAAAGLEDAWTTLKDAAKMTAFQVGAALAPALTEFAKRIAEVVAATTRWIKEHRGLVVSLAKGVAAAFAAGAALFVLGKAVTVAGVGLGIVATALTAFGAILGAILTPIGLVSTGILALGGYIVYATDIGGQAVQWLADRFADLKADAVEAWSGIGAALASGDLALAAQILWLTLKLEWTKGINFLSDKWETFGKDMLDAFDETVTGIRSMWNEASTWLAKKFVESAAGWKLAWIEARTDDPVERAHKMVQAIKDAEDAKKGLEGQAALENENLGKALTLRSQARQAAYDAARQGDEEALAKARREWEAAIAQAKAAGEAAPGGPASPERFAGVPGMTAGGRGEAIGSFMAFAWNRVGYGTTAADRTAAATERTAKATERTAWKVDSLATTFD